MNHWILVLLGVLGLLHLLALLWLLLRKPKVKKATKNPTAPTVPVSPVAWEQQSFQKAVAPAVCHSPNAPTLYVLESHQVVQQLIREYAQQNACNAFFFNELSQLSHFFNEQIHTQQSHLPTVILASDLCDGRTLLSHCLQNTQLKSAKFIMLSQGSLRLADTFATLKKPLDAQELAQTLNLAIWEH